MLNVSDSYAKTFQVTQEIVEEIARISGDKNPLHLDEEYAKTTTFGKCIAHGLFCVNAISMILVNYFPGKGTILISQQFEYKKPVFINDTIEVMVTVKEIVIDRSVYILSNVCTNQTGEIVLDGISKVKVINFQV